MKRLMSMGEAKKVRIVSSGTKQSVPNPLGKKRDGKYSTCRHFHKKNMRSGALTFSPQPMDCYTTTGPLQDYSRHWWYKGRTVKNVNELSKIFHKQLLLHYIIKKSVHYEEGFDMKYLKIILKSPYVINRAEFIFLLLPLSL